MTTLNTAEICELIPHREPFLWVDEVTDVTESRIEAKKFVSPDMDVFRGHYPHHPILPGVILCEAIMQAGAILIARQADALPAGSVPVVTRLNNVKFKQMVRPGDTLQIEAQITDKVAKTYYLKGKIRVADKTAVELEFACMAVPPAPATSPPA